MLKVSYSTILKQTDIVSRDIMGGLSDELAKTETSPPCVTAGVAQ